MNTQEAEQNFQLLLSYPYILLPLNINQQWDSSSNADQFKLKAKIHLLHVHADKFKLKADLISMQLHKLFFFFARGGGEGGFKIHANNVLRPNSYSLSKLLALEVPSFTSSNRNKALRMMPHSANWRHPFYLPLSELTFDYQLLILLIFKQSTLGAEAGREWSLLFFTSLMLRIMPIS